METHSACAEQESCLQLPYCNSWGSVQGHDITQNTVSESWLAYAYGARISSLQKQDIIITIIKSPSLLRYLSYNRITALPANAFQGLSQLDWL
jgi:hypothetical protein